MLMSAYHLWEFGFHRSWKGPAFVFFTGSLFQNISPSQSCDYLLGLMVLLDSWVELSPVIILVWTPMLVLVSERLFSYLHRNRSL